MKISKILFVTLMPLAILPTMVFSQNWNLVGGVNDSIGSSPSISVYGANSMVVAGGIEGAPYVARSTNGGANFTKLGKTGLLLELYCVWAVDDNTIYAGDGGSAGGNGGNAHVYMTTNGGATWSIILSTGGSSGFINGIAFSRTNPQVGIIESDPPSGSGNFWLQKTTNGGATWTLQQPPGSSDLITSQNSLIITDVNHYGFGTGHLLGSGSSYVIFTVNGGTSWQTTQVSALPFCSAFAMASDWTIGIASASSANPISILRTTNGCTSFSNASGDSTIRGIPTAKWVYGTQHVYLAGTVGSTGTIEQSDDGGLSWSIMNSSGLNSVKHMDLVYDIGSTILDAYAICSDKSILQLVTNVIGIDPNNTRIPVSYKLEQNYPNPFNPATKIKYSLSKYSFVTLNIYDVLGHEVKNLVSSYQSAGNYVESVDISGLASGIYFYTLTADNYTETKKMTLIK